MHLVRNQIIYRKQNQIWDQVRNQVNNQIYYQVMNLISNQVRNPVLPRVLAEFGINLNEIT